MEEQGKYGRLGIVRENGETPLKEGMFKFGSNPDEPPRLVGSKCKSCGDISFPARLYCHLCESQETEEFLFSNRGKIYSYTVIHQGGVPGVEPPYGFAIVCYPEADDVRVPGQTTGCDPNELRIGMEVETVIDKVRSGLLFGDVIGYKFRPVK